MLDRRYMLSRAVVGAIAIPAAALPAVANATAPDPVLVALAAEAKAQAASRAASTRLEQIEARWAEKFSAAPDYITLADGTRVRTREHLRSCMGRHNPRRQHELKVSVDAILRTHFPDAAPIPPLPEPSPGEVRAFRRRVRAAERRLQTALNKRTRLEEESGFTAAEAEYETRMDDATAAESAVLIAKPTTMEGAVALVRYVDRYLSNFTADAEVRTALKNISAFFSSLDTGGRA